MTALIFLLLVAAVSAAAVIATIRAAGIDGYRRSPSKLRLRE